MKFCNSEHPFETDMGLVATKGKSWKEMEGVISRVNES